MGRQIIKKKKRPTNWQYNKFGRNNFWNYDYGIAVYLLKNIILLNCRVDKQCVIIIIKQLYFVLSLLSQTHRKFNQYAHIPLALHGKVDHVWLTSAHLAVSLPAPLADTAVGGAPRGAAHSHGVTVTLRPALVWNKHRHVVKQTSRLHVHARELMVYFCHKVNPISSSLVVRAARNGFSF